MKIMLINEEKNDVLGDLELGNISPETQNVLDQIRNWLDRLQVKSFKNGVEVVWEDGE